MNDVLIRVGEGTQREYCVKMKAEIGLMHLQTKEHQGLPRQPPEARTEATDSPSEPPEKASLADT